MINIFQIVPLNPLKWTASPFLKQTYRLMFVNELLTVGLLKQVMCCVIRINKYFILFYYTLKIYCNNKIVLTCRANQEKFIICEFMIKFFLVN